MDARSAEILALALPEPTQLRTTWTIQMSELIK
jgi:hypothetical protein